MPAKKTKIKVAPRRKGGKLLGPSFDGWETWTGELFNKVRFNAHNFYYENYKMSDLIPSVWEWMLQNGYTKDDVKKAKAAPAGRSSISITTAIICKLLEDGCPDFNDEHNNYWKSCKGTTGEIKPLSEYIISNVRSAIAAGSDRVEDTNEDEIKEQSNKPTIQERIFEQSSTYASDIDKWIDTFFDDPKKFEVESFNVSSYLTSNNVSQAHARKIVGFYESDYQEIIDYSNIPTSSKLKALSEQERDYIEQLQEGYGHISKANIKKLISVYQNIFDACNMLIEAAKTTRKTRKPKQHSSSKLVEKLNYKKQDDKYSLVSVNPTSIIGANELWIFNSKTRKIGKYVAQNIDPKGMSRDGTGLTVKGTSIQGFDESKSIQKTLRKPEEQLKEFKSAGKVALRKYLDNVPTVDSKMSGRINSDIILLKVN